MKDPAAACVTQNGGRIVTALEREIALCRARCGELQAELANTKEKLERYEQALMILTDNAPPADRQRVYTSQIEQVIVAYVLEHGEFRQVDIRAAFGNELAPSSALKAARARPRASAACASVNGAGIRSFEPSSMYLASKS